jgi:gliding motility-associated-like protein
VKKLMYIWLILILAANAAAQENYVIDSVCIDAERFYRVDGEEGSTYLWAITSTTGDTILQSDGIPFTDPKSPGFFNYGSKQPVLWNAIGIFQITTIQWSIHGCDTVQQGDVKVFEPPYVFAGNDQFICNIDTINLVEAVAQNYSSLLWTTLGDGYFTSKDSLNTHYVAGVIDHLQGIVTLVATANGLALNETCTPATDTIEIWFSNPLLTFNHRDLLCYNDNSGYIKAVISSGNEPFIYDWTGPNGFTASTDSIYGLASGEYIVTVTDNIGCQVNDTLVLTQPDELIAVIDSSENVTCFGGNNGFARVTVTGGTGNYNYLWDTWPQQYKAEAVNLTAGTYRVTVKDINDCEAVAFVTISEPPLLVLTADSIDAKCMGGVPGSVDLTVTGGTPFPTEPYYLYEWRDVNGIFANTEDITGLTGNMLYTVVVTDAVGCTDTLSIFVNEENDLVLDLVKIDSILCYGDANGAIDISVSGGTLPFTFVWSNGADTEDLANIPAGTYHVSVTDINGCNQKMSFTLTEPDELLVKVDANLYEICEKDTVFLNSTANGGTGSYTHLWSGSGAIFLNASDIVNPFLTGAPAGNYSLTYTVTDENNCLADTTINLVVWPITYNTVYDTICDSDLPYTWNNDTYVAAGIYENIITNSFGCDSVITFNLHVYDPIVLAANSVNDGIHADPSGSIDLTVSGGTLPYTFNWSNGETTEDITGLTAGDYTVKVTDFNGCTETLTVTVSSDLGDMTVTVVPTHVDCYGNNTGAIELTVTDGVPNYTYSWDNGETTQNLNGLYAGTYRVTVSDSRGATKNITVVITEPEQLIISSTKVDVGNSPDPIGKINLTVQGGTGPYEFAWTGTDGFVSNKEDINNLPKGNYTVIVTDAHGCTEILAFVISGYGMTCPLPIFVECDITRAPAPFTNLAQYEAAGAKIESTIKLVESTFTVAGPDVSDGKKCPETFTRTYTIQNADGEWITCEQLIIVDDTEKPILKLARPKPLTCREELASLKVYTNRSQFEAVAGNIAEDNCELDWSTFRFVSQVSDNNTCPEQITRWYTISDMCGNTTNAMQIIVIDDKIKPYAMKPMKDIFTACEIPKPYRNRTEFETNSGGYVIENCNNGNYTITHVGDSDPTGDGCPTTIIRTYRFTDLCGNFNEYTQKIILNDTIAPLISCPKDVEFDAESDQIASLTGLAFAATETEIPITDTKKLGVSASDNCKLVQITYFDVITGNCPAEVIRTFTAVDGCGNTAKCEQKIQFNFKSIVAVSLIIDQNPVCEGETVTFTATPSNGGNNPVYAWFVNGLEIPGKTGNTFVYQPKVGDVVYVKLTSNDKCVTDPVALSDTIIISVTDGLIVKVDIEADKTEICKDETVTFTAFPENGGENPVYAWFVNGNEITGETQVTYSYKPKNGDQVYVKLTSSEICVINPVAISDTITINVIDALNASVKLPGHLLVCEGDSVTLTAETENGGTNPVYKWFVNNIEIVGENAGTYSYFPTNKDEIYVTVESDIICLTDKTAISNRILISVGDTIPPEAISRNIKVYLDVNGNASVTTSQIDNGSFDNCELDTLFLSRYDFGCEDIGENPVILTAIDAVGLSGTSDAIVTVLDTFPPVVICRGPYEIQLDENAEYKLTVAEVLEDASDACGIDSMYVFPHDLNCDNIGLTTITLWAIGVNGDSSFCQTEVTIFGNRPPEVIDDSATTVQNIPVVIDILENDFDEKTSIDISSLSVNIKPLNGKVSVNPVNGDLTYTPNLNFSGIDVVEYRICDDGIPCDPECGTAFVFIRVLAINQAPLAVDNRYIAGCYSVTGNILDNDSDPDSDNQLTIETNPLTPTNHGSVIIETDGFISYFPNEGFIGIDSFQYVIWDNGLPDALSDTAWVYFEVDCSEETDDPLDCELFVPEGFSPNKDGIHDFFRIMCIQEYPDAKLMIFNRNGDLLWQKEHYGNYDVWGDQYNAWWWGNSEFRWDQGTRLLDGQPGKIVKVANYIWVLELGNGDRKNGTVMVQY